MTGWSRRSTAGDSHLGGDDFDRRLVDYLADEFQRENNIDLRKDPQALQRLFEAAEKAKVELSSVAQTQVNLPLADANGPKHLTMAINRSSTNSPTIWWSAAWARSSRRWPTPR